MPSGPETVIIEEVPHSTRGASSSHRWLKCTGSILLAERLARQGAKINRAGPAAAEGTTAHTVSATALEEGTEAWEFAGMEFSVGGWTFVVDEEMQNSVQMYLDLVRDLLIKYKNDNPVIYIEKPLASILHEDAWGTPDVTILVPGKKIIVIDFKHGRGVSVEPDSSQNRYYGYLACENYLNSFDDVPEVELWIAQPRIPHPKGECRSFTTTPAELEKWWNETLIPGIEATYDPNATLLVGEHCRFCPARDACPALKKEVFDFNLEIEPDYMTDDEVGEILEKKSAIMKYFERAEQEAFKRAMQGKYIPGQKLVRKKTNRIFREEMTVPDPEDAEKKIVLKLEEEAKKKFGDEAYTDPTLRSPPQIEKLDGGKSFVSKWAYKPDAGLTLAPLSDKRDPVKRPMEEFMDSMDGDSDAPY